MLGMAAPVAAVAPSYFFAPVGGWPRRFIGCDWGFGPSKTIITLINPSSPDPSWVKEMFLGGMIGSPYLISGGPFTKPSWIADEYLGISRAKQ
jgi:hypothetical protein